MAVPDFQSVMLPLLTYLADGKVRSISETIEPLAQQFQLTADELNEMIPSNRQTKFYNRVSWAYIYLARAGLLERQRRGYYQITSQGKTVLESKTKRIDIRFLRQFPSFVEFRDVKSEADSEEHHTPSNIATKTPEEVMDDAYQEIRDTLAQDILTNVMKCSPAFFERMVVELLVKMGYGGSRTEAARAVGQTGDGGIDGIIDEDRLGLDTIYIQAKRWEPSSSIGRPEIQRFVGALMGRRARKGIFITTANFSAEARAYVNNIDFKVVLIDGKRLAEFMIDYDVGVTNILTYQLKRIDSDYFIDDGSSFVP